MRLEDGAVTVIADLPKKVEWNQATLARMSYDLNDAYPAPAFVRQIAAIVIGDAEALDGGPGSRSS